MQRRARASADAASVTHTSKPWDQCYEATAAELYRQSAHWAARALVEESPGSPTASDGNLWDAVDDQLLSPPEGGVTSPQVLRELVRSSSFAELAELSRDDLYRALLSLRALTQVLLTKFDERGASVAKLRRQRFWRLGGLFVCLLALVQGAAWMRAARLQRSELAAGKSWRLSSNYGSGGCKSPEQSCSENTGFFFHTRVNEHSPWIEFDLAAPRQVSVVEVENRTDCCSDRALPLAIEVSQDHRSWHAVAHRDADFSTWRASFGAVQARWVRLRVLKPSTLHLHAVRIYP
jgi:hypothetical protein